MDNLTQPGFLGVVLEAVVASTAVIYLLLGFRWALSVVVAVRYRSDPYMHSLTQPPGFLEAVLEVVEVPILAAGYLHSFAQWEMLHQAPFQPSSVVEEVPHQ